MTQALLGEREPLLPTKNSNDERDSRSNDNWAISDSSTPTKTSFDSEDFRNYGHEEEEDDDDDDDDDEDDDDDDEPELKRRREERLKETGGWLGYLRDFGIFLPYLIPRNDLKVQACFIVCFLCLAGRRILNIMVPHQLGVIADKCLNGQPLYQDLFLWLGLNILNDDSGLGLIQELALVPIRQFSERQITNAAFKHVLDLSMDFHEERDSAEVMKALEQGGALTKLLQTAACEILPTTIDLTVALGVLYWKFGIYTSLIVVAALLLFFTLEILTSSWKVEPRRRFAKAERKEARVMHQAIQGWTTVSYFNMFRFERWRFGKTLDAKLTAERKWFTIESLAQGGVELLIPLTFFALTANTVSSISQGRSKPGDFVFLIQYWEYLMWPLKFLSHEYRDLLSNLIDAERLLALLQVSPTVFDRKDAHDIGSVNGHVAFENVSFAYSDRNTTIENVNFSAQPGQTIALAGATGAGKSTIVKLLLRFYDINGGRITIDGHDIHDVTLDSLRKIFGVVPQDPMLFNGTILENLRYARPSATFPEIIAACRTAEIHDRILSFPDGYRTRVGEQGVKVSGGEAQRLAIARAVLKDPSILILDEATSAIDTHTESNIQMALDAFKARRPRTTFVIAHRLNTIIRADQILVFDKGNIVERGTHEELLRKEGVYKALWSKQTDGSDE